MYFSTELRGHDIEGRIGAIILGVSHHEILDGRVAKETRAKALRTHPCR